MLWLLLILASALALGLYTPMMKHTLQHEKNTQIIALYPLIASIIIIILRPVDLAIITTPTGWLLALKAFTIGLTLYCTSLALKYLPVSIYSPMRNLSPFFLFFLGWLLLGERIGTSQFLGLIIIIVGAVLLDIDFTQRHQLRRLRRFFKQPAILLLILAAITISFSPIFDRLILRETDAYTALFWYLLLMSAMYWILHIVKERRLPIQKIKREEWLWIASMGVIIMISDWLYFKAVTLPGTIMVVLIGTRRLSNLFSTLLGGKLFHEGRILYRSAMCLLMILGTVLLVL